MTTVRVKGNQVWFDGDCYTISQGIDGKHLIHDSSGDAYGWFTVDGKAIPAREKTSSKPGFDVLLIARHWIDAR